MKQTFSIEIALSINPPDGMNKAQAERWINGAVESGREFATELREWLEKHPLVQSAKVEEGTKGYD